MKMAALVIFFLLFQLHAFPQEGAGQHKAVYDSVTAQYDSAANKLFHSINQFGIDEERKNAIEYHEDTIATQQEEIIEEIRRLTLEAKSYLEKGFDTTGLDAELTRIKHWYAIASDGVFVKTGGLQTNRNLQTSHQIIKELLTRTLARKSSMYDYYKTLVGLRNTIDSLYKEKVLYTFSSDSAALMRYVRKLTVVSQEVKPIDSSFKLALTNVSEMQTAINEFVNILSASSEKLQDYDKDLSSKRYRRETSNLGGPVKFVRPFNEIIDFSLIKAGLALVFYVRNEIFLILAIAGLVLIAATFLKNLKKRLQSEGATDQNLEKQSVLKYPVLSATIIVLNLFQFVLPDPPFILNALIWTFSSLALTVIMRHILSGYWLKAWLVMLTLFILGCADNLILQASRFERWIMFILAIAGLVASVTIILMGRRQQLKEKMVVYFIALVAVLQIASIIANVYGRYNLSKTCLMNGFLGIILAVLFFWTIRLLTESLLVIKKVYEVSGKQLFYINPGNVGDKTPNVFYVLFAIGWSILFARNFYASKLIADPVRIFISQKRMIGDFSFTIGSLLEFFVILYLAGLISRIVSFFASQNYDSSKQRVRIGSWLLIIRIVIVSIGLLLAFAVLGIPMDRLTIILSALGVGIGFGLQTLVNNLVSGLIISFEKPVNVGDIVEIQGQSGTIKSIGFRSSVLSTGNGSEVVIPNGNLLNQNLINWTHDNNAKSVDVLLSVAHGTNLEKVIQLLKSLPQKDERVLADPGPTVTVKDFTNNSINLQLLFWVSDLREWAAVKSDIILAMDLALKENGIQIAPPQA